jgi:hypothetical protein
VTRSCRPLSGNSTETAGQGGVIGLLPRWRGTREGRKVGSAADGDGTLVIGGGGEGFLQLEGSTNEGEEVDDDDDGGQRGELAKEGKKRRRWLEL